MWPKCDRIGRLRHIHHPSSLWNHPHVCFIHWCSLSPSWTLSVLSRMVRAAGGNWKLGTTCTIHHYTMREQHLFSSNFLYGCPHLGDLQDSTNINQVFSLSLLPMLESLGRWVMLNACNQGYGISSHLQLQIFGIQLSNGTCDVR